MALQTRTALKALFEDGDAPSSSNHDDWVDSLRREDDEESITSYAPGLINGDKILIMVAPRKITIKNFYFFSQSSPSFNGTLYYNSGGTEKQITAFLGFTPLDHTTAASTPGVGLTTFDIASIPSGASIYLEIGSVSSPFVVARTSFTMRYSS